MKDILERLADSHANEGSHDLQCRCFDAAAEISRLRVQRDELLAALSEYIAAADNSMNPPDDDDVAAMLRFADADKAARVAIAKAAA